MAINSCRRLGLLALFAISGCASPEHATMLYQGDEPIAAKTATLRRLPPIEQASSGATVNSIEASLSPPAGMQFVDTSVPRAKHAPSVDPRSPLSATPLSYHDPGPPSAQADSTAPLRDTTSIHPFAMPANPAYARDDALPTNQLLEPPSGGLTYTDLFANQASGVISDYQQFYSLENTAWLAGGVAAGALMANTGFDEHFIRDAYLENIVLAPSDELYEKLHQPKFLGDGYYTIPAFTLAALAEPLIDDLPLGSETAAWGQRSLRTILVGGPPLLALQWLTGGGRPDETYESSEWQPLHDNNGVSGHSFMGAIPLISAAKMTDNVWLKGGLYVASTLPAISRINDDAHYFSQAFVGWWLAYLAECAVDRSFDSNAPRRWNISPSGNSAGIVISTQW